MEPDLPRYSQQFRVEYIDQVLVTEGLEMSPRKTPRDARAAALRRLEIEALAAEYRIAFGIPHHTRLPPGTLRETMIPAILDREFLGGEQLVRKSENTPTSGNG